jgi:hypothetical protein
MKIGAIQMSNRGLRCRRIRHFDKCEAARLARVSVCDDIHPFHATVSGESRMKIVLGTLKTKVSDKYICHNVNSFFVDLSLSKWSETDFSKGNVRVATGRHSRRRDDAGKDIVMLSRL